MKKNKFLLVITLIIFVTITSIISYSNVFANSQKSETIEQEANVITNEEKAFYSATETKIESCSIE